MLQEYGKIADHPSTLPFHTSGEHSNGVLRPHPPFRAETRPDVISQLEWLDDLMFAAIDGDPVALEAAALAWHKTVDELGVEATEESRHQYLRRAQSVWCGLRCQPDQPPYKVLAAIEVISLLAGRVW